MGPYFAVTSRYLPDKEHHPVRVLQCFNYMKDVDSYDRAVSQPHHLNSTYVIKCSLSFTVIINDMKRIYKSVFKSKKPSQSSIHGPGPATSTSTSTGTTDLIPSIPSFDSVGTASTQVNAGVSVRVQLRPSHLLSIDLLLSSRPPVIQELIPRFSLWISVIFLL